MSESSQPFGRYSTACLQKTICFRFLGFPGSGVVAKYLGFPGSGLVAIQMV